jgi:ABC-type Mn2+/Zn2+ transport system ATPase subunit
MNLIETRKKVNALLTSLELAEKNFTNEQLALREVEDNLTFTEEAQEIAQHVAQTIQQKAHERIAGVVSRCLETVFPGDKYGFKIYFDRKRGRTEARLVLTKDGNEIVNPLNSDSGGAVEVAAFALRLSCLMLSKPKLRRVLILDEPFKAVSEEYWDNVRMLLEGLAKDFKVQFILVTHNKELQIGKVIKL